jgi:hypothetical protein
MLIILLIYEVTPIDLSTKFSNIIQQSLVKVRLNQIFSGVCDNISATIIYVA